MLILGGNVHAMKASPPGMTPAFAFAEAVLTGRKLSLNVRSAGGSSWNCSTADDCGPHPAPTYPARPRGLTLTSDEPRLFDGAIDVGGPATASPPAVQAAR